MNARKTYHIVASRAGAFGATSHAVRLPERYTNKREADSARARMAREPEPRTVYFIEWEWRIEAP